MSAIERITAFLSAFEALPPTQWPAGSDDHDLISWDFDTGAALRVTDLREVVELAWQYEDLNR